MYGTMKKLAMILLMVFFAVSAYADKIIEAEEPSGIKIEEESTNNRSSYDPDTYDYTFGLIPTEELDIYFASHLYMDTTMLYGYPTIGATWDIGLGVDTVTIAAYVKYAHFFKPLGSGTGNLYIAEEMTEIGLSFKVRAYELGRFNVSFGINTGWYQQWLMHYSSANTYSLVNNGLMIRPEASIGWNWIGRWNMEIGLFYQTPLYPTYEGYNGWGVFIKLV